MRRLVRAGLAAQPARSRTADAANGTGRIEIVVARGLGAPQEYHLAIRLTEIEITAGSMEGLHDALQTLSQLAEGGLPCVEIDDRPDFIHRGVLLDISRCRVPTMRELKRLIDWLAALKINELQLYTEHTFAYRRHRAVWRGCSPLTADDVRRLDAYCRERFIELVPNQNSLGHMERWLKHPRYASLAEAVGSYRTPWKEIRRTPTTLNPLDPRSLRLVDSLYAELLPNFSSRRLNVGCDEPFELGQGRSRKACRQRGRGRVFVDYLRKLRDTAARHGRRILFWGDVLAAHPRELQRIPRDATVLEWGYEADHPFKRRAAACRRAGLAFYVCPGTSSWCSFGGRTSNALANLRAAAQAGRRHGAIGYLVTDWGDFGHRQYWPVSLAPILYGACLAWNADADRTLDLERAASWRAFGDPTGRAARAWLDLGEVYRLTGVSLRNQTSLFRCLRGDFDDPAAIAGLRPAALRRTQRRLTELRRRARPALFRTSDGPLVFQEYVATVDVLLHACRRAAAMAAHQRGGNIRRELVALASDMRAIIRRHRRLWTARNRPGGLAESVAYYRRNLREYLERMNALVSGPKATTAARIDRRAVLSRRAPA